MRMCMRMRPQGLGIRSSEELYIEGLLSTSRKARVLEAASVLLLLPLLLLELALVLSLFYEKEGIHHEN